MASPRSGNFRTKVEARFDHNVREAGVGSRLIKLKGRSQNLMRTLEPESFDIVYIDACHDAACVYIDAALGWLLLKENGFLVFDDYGFRVVKSGREPAAVPFRPKLAIDAFIESFLPYMQVLHLHKQIIIKKLKKGPSALD